MSGFSITICWHPFDDLTPRQLHDILKLRGDVFVTEQACAFSDIDGRDPRAVHGMATRGDDVVATARLLFDDAVGLARVGRFVTQPEVRGQGVGAALMRDALAEIGRRWGAVPVMLGAQTRVQGFYERFGFVPCSEVYDEDGIPHVEMRRAPDAAPPGR
jgi:ElaA protein